MLVDARWLRIVDEDTMTVEITPFGIRAFWDGVKKHGAKAIMGKPRQPRGPGNVPPPGGTPVAVAA
mgnify:CR=1 FL=1